MSFKTGVVSSSEPHVHSGLTRCNLACGLVALVWLLGAPQLRLLPFDDRLVLADVAQFYMAGHMVAIGKADALYPVARAGSTRHPGLPADSELRPAYRAECERLGVSADAARFIGPPPLAVMLVPIGLLPYRAILRLWPALLALAQWGIAVVAARLVAAALGRHSLWEGTVMLAVAFSPHSYVAVAQGNVTPLVGFAIALGIWSALSGRYLRSGVALTAGVTLKYAPLALLPLLLAARRWRVIAAASASGAVLLVGSLLAVGPGPFQVWIYEIAPRLGRPYLDPYNQSVWSALARWTAATEVGSSLRRGLLAVGLAALLVLVALLLRRPRDERCRPAFFMAGAAGLIAWLLIFSPLSWNTYQVYLMPFWGWLVWEGTRSWRWGAAAVAAVAIGYVPWLSLWSMAFGSLPPQALMFSGLWSCAGILALATARMWQGSRPPA